MKHEVRMLLLIAAALMAGILILFRLADDGTRQADTVNVYGIQGLLATYSGGVRYRQPADDCVEILLEDGNVKYVNCNVEIIGEL